MALIKFGGGITAMSGSIAGNTFARNRFGYYSRARTKPVNPKTDAQTAVRSALAYLTEYWSETLNIAQRAAWNLYGASVAMKNRLGETIYLTGFNHFIRSNMVRMRYSYGVIAAAPVDFTLPEKDTTYTISAVAATNTIDHNYNNTAPWANEDGAYMWVSCGKPQNKQRNFFDGPWKVVGAQDGSSLDPHASPYQTNSIWEISAGQRIWCYARIGRADGRLSEPFRANIVVSA